MKKIFMFLLCLALLLVSCDQVGETPSQPKVPSSPPPAVTPVETPVETPAEEEEPSLVLKEGDVEVIQGSIFDAVSLIESGNYDDINFTSIDTSVAGEQELVITITKNGKTKEYTKTINVVRPITEISWEMKKEGPVFLIHPEKLSGSPEEDDVKSFYEYPVFTSEPAQIAEKMNEIIDSQHIWGVAQMFKTMSNSINPEYGNADILQARTKVSEGKEAIVVHTTYVVAQFRSGNFGESHIVTIFDTATGLPISKQQLLARYNLETDDLLNRLNQFLSEQKYYVGNMEGVEPYRPDMTEDEMTAYFEHLINLTASDEYVTVFLDDTLEASDLEGKLIFVEDGKLYSEFIVFQSLENLAINMQVMEVGPIE